MQNLTDNGRQLARTVSYVQLVVGLILSSGFFVITGQFAGISALVGMACILIPQLIFGFFAFRFGGARHNERVVRSFNQGAKIKLMLVLIFCVVAFSSIKVAPVPFFSTFAATIAAQWLAMLQWARYS